MMPLEDGDLFLLQRGDDLYSVTLDELKTSIQEALQARIIELEQEVAVLKSQQGMSND